MDNLLKIANYLIMNAVNTFDVSLYHGKMGMVCALYTYAVRTNNENIKDYSWDLLQDVYDTAYDTLPLGVERGLVGLGFGIAMINSLMQKNGDLNNILGDLDNKIMSHDPRRITDMSFRNGALGVWSYIAMRRKCGKLTSIDELYQKELAECIFRNVGESLQPIHVIDDLRRPLWDISEYSGKSMDIDGGMSYYLLMV